MLTLLLLIFLSETNEIVIKKEVVVIEGIVSGYSSEVGQTDSTPFTMANNKRVRDGVIANNCLPFGTKVVIAGKEYEVSDRMNRRYDCSHWDIWFSDRSLALEFGRQNKYILIK